MPLSKTTQKEMQKRITGKHLIGRSMAACVGTTLRPMQTPSQFDNIFMPDKFTHYCKAH